MARSNPSHHTTALLAVVLMAGLLMAGLGSTTAEGQQCTDIGWFIDTKTPPPLLAQVTQAAQSSVPDNGTCQFHEFAWQNFLALTLGERPRFAQWPTSEDIFRQRGEPLCTASALGSALGPRLRQLATGSREELGDIQEASGGPLVDQNGRYIQFEVRLDPRTCGFVASCQLYDTNCVFKATADPNVRFPAGGETIPGTLELKTAWRVLETCDLPDSPKEGCRPDDPSRYFHIGPLTVAPYSPAHQGAVQGVRMGLVGLHLVQKTTAHPEMVWATWEHMSNAPVCPSVASTPSAVACQDPSAPGPSGWSLYDPDCRGDACAVNTPHYDASHPESQPISQVCRQNPCGGGKDAELKNEKNLAALNQTLRPKLTGTPWQYYFLVGSLWTKESPHTPVAPLRCIQWADKAHSKCLEEVYDPTVGNENGSLLLANTTMETWTQWIVTALDNTSKKRQTSCFAGCHQEANSGLPGIYANVDFTHVLIRAQQGSADPGQCTTDFAKCWPLMSAHEKPEPQQEP